MLDTHRLSGDRTKKHFHYLKGSIFCGHCGRRMVYGRHRGNGGVYEYFSCLSHQARRPSCGAKHLPVADVEKAIEEFYRSIQLTPEQTDKVRRDVGEQVEERLAIARKQSEQHSRRLRTLQDEQQKLVSSTTKAASPRRSSRPSSSASNQSAPKPTTGSRPQATKPKTSWRPSKTR